MRGVITKNSGPLEVNTVVIILTRCAVKGRVRILVPLLQNEKMAAKFTTVKKHCLQCYDKDSTVRLCSKKHLIDMTVPDTHINTYEATLVYDTRYKKIRLQMQYCLMLRHNNMLKV